jgi:hypothetical protein
MSSSSEANAQDADGLEVAIDQAIAACGGDMRSTIRALIVANEYLETEVTELMKAVSHAYAREISYLFRLGANHDGSNLIRRPAFRRCRRLHCGP